MTQIGWRNPSNGQVVRSCKRGYALVLVLTRILIRPV